MGRPKGAGKILDKKEQDGRHIAIVEAIKAKRQACLEALEQPLPLSTLSILTDLAGLNSPLRPSMPLAQASKLAAYCAITLHLNQQHYRVPEGKLMAIVLGLISKATQWAWQGVYLPYLPFMCPSWSVSFSLLSITCSPALDEMHIVMLHEWT